MLGSSPAMCRGESEKRIPQPLIVSQQVDKQGGDEPFGQSSSGQRTIIRPGHTGSNIDDDVEVEGSHFSGDGVRNSGREQRVRARRGGMDLSFSKEESTKVDTRR